MVCKVAPLLNSRGNVQSSQITQYLKTVSVMSQKKRKSIGPIWYICDICKSILQVKDTSIHKENSCCTNETSLIHPYVKNECLYTKVETFKLEDADSFKNIPVGRQNDFVFIPTSALQLIKVPIGDPVKISHINSDTFTVFVKRVWPWGEKNLSALISKQVSGLYCLDSVDGVSINAMKESIGFTKEIVLNCETDVIFNIEGYLTVKLLNQISGNIYCVGNKFTYSHYGKLLTFEIIDIKPLFQGVENRNVKENQTKPCEFYIVTEETVLKFCGKNDLHIKKEKKIQKIGGLDNTLKELNDIVSLALCNDHRIAGVHITRGILIFGPGGTGKTTLIESMALQLNVNMVKIDTCQVFSKYLGEAERQLVKKFEKAKQLSPAIILIDDLDVICPKINSRNDQEKRIIVTLSTLLDKVHNEDESIIVFATTSKLGDIHKSLRRPGRFGKEIEIYVPNSKGRKEILQIYLENINHDLEDKDVKDIADLSHGFVGADLISLVSKAVFRNRRKTNGNSVSAEDFYWALSKVKPSAMREVLVEIPNVHWCDIGGQEELKLKLKQAIEWPLKYEDSFKRLGIIPPRGLLMFGPPGCSKTMIAKALATESKLNFISVKGPELFNKWVGESERAVREVFRRARQVAPSVVFFDELDAIGGERNTSGEGSCVEERVLAQLLTELDGVEPLGNVIVVGATNRLDRIDPALLRPGRFDRIVYVPLPNAETRRQILQIHFKKTPVANDVDVDELVQKSEGYSGAEIVAVSHEAALKALEEDFSCDAVKRKHFLTAFDIIIPRTPQFLIQIYEKYLYK